MVKERFANVVNEGLRAHGAEQQLGSRSAFRARGTSDQAANSEKPHLRPAPQATSSHKGRRTPI
jgi:hypothetical protein